MKHEFATTTHAAERYLLHEMTAEERDAFEEHYFACDVCAEDVKLTSQFIEAAKAVWSDDAEAPPKSSLADWFRMKWLSPATLAVATAAVAVIAYQNAVVIPALNAPRAIPALALDLTSRAAVPQLKQGDPLHFDVGTERPVSANTVWAELISESGKVLRSGPVAGPKPDQPVDVYFPGKLEPGRYKLVIRSLRSGHPEEVLANDSFEVEP